MSGLRKPQEMPRRPGSLFYVLFSNRSFPSYRGAGHTDYYSLLKVLDRDGTQVIVPNDKQLYKLRAFAVLKDYIYSEETKVTLIGNQ